MLAMEAIGLISLSGQVMSRNGQMLDENLHALLESADGPPLIAYEARGEIPLEETDWHSHVRGQFFYVEQGLVITRTEHGSWLLPPHRAGWMPPGEMHTVSIAGPSHAWGVFIAPCAVAGLPDRPCVVGVNDLFRAIIKRAAGWPRHAESEPERDRLFAVMLDEMRRAPVEHIAPAHAGRPALAAHRDGDVRTPGRHARHRGMGQLGRHVRAHAHTPVPPGNPVQRGAVATTGKAYPCPRTPGPRRTGIDRGRRARLRHAERLRGDVSQGASAIHPGATWRVRP